MLISHSRALRDFVVNDTELEQLPSRIVHTARYYLLDNIESRFHRTLARQAREEHRQLAHRARQMHSIAELQAKVVVEIPEQLQRDVLSNQMSMADFRDVVRTLNRNFLHDLYFASGHPYHQRR